MLSLFLPNTNVDASVKSITGDTLLLVVSILTPRVKDLLLGKEESLLDSFTLEQTILGEFSLLLVLRLIDSNPKSLNDTSDPAALVPETVLNVEEIFVLFGTRTLN